VQAVMSAKEGASAARRKLDEGVSRGATSAWPVATTPPGGVPAPGRPPRRAGPLRRFFHRLLGRLEAP